MTMQPHRNDPCPCGSGKKYKNCHLREDETAGAPPLAEEHDGAVELAVAWLVERHRKGFKTAFEKLRDEVLPADDPLALARVARADDRIMEALQINLTEWLLAEGEILVRGDRRRVVEVLIGPDGPRLTDGQRRWLAQAGERPLRLYTVTNVQLGEGVTLCDTLDADALPLVVRERMGSRSMKAGMLMGCRVMQLPGHHELTGALYPFTALAAPSVTQAVREAAFGAQPGNPRRLAGLTIMRAWFSQFVQPPAMPQLVDAQSGEPLLLVTDHYRVVDSTALAQALAACGDVTGDAQSGWRREFEGKDQLIRTSAAINPGKQADRIEVFYRTQRLADDGRVWFDAVAGAAAQFLTREISDPRQRAATPTRADEER